MLGLIGCLEGVCGGGGGCSIHILHTGYGVFLSYIARSGMGSLYGVLYAYLGTNEAVLYNIF